MNHSETGGPTATATASQAAWDCAGCGHRNRPGRGGVSALTCEACGLAKRTYGEPPLDLPPPPSLTEVPSFWFAVAWLLAAAGGTALLLYQGFQELSNVGRTFYLVEIGGSLYAAFSSLLNAVWERWFNLVQLQVPNHAATGQSFTATLKLVPYRDLQDVTVRLRLIDRFYEREAGKSTVKTLSRVLGSFTMLRSGDLRGRREAHFEAGFVAPFPATKHVDITAEMTADVLDVVGRFVPAVSWNAANLREHGGYVVEAEMSVGLVKRRLHKRLIAYHLGEQVHVG